MNATRAQEESMSHPVPDTIGVYALLADGTTVQIRPSGPGDFEAVKAMHDAMSPNNAYLRFFSTSKNGVRARGAADQPGTGAGPRRPARGLRRRGRRRRQLRGRAQGGIGGKTAEVAFAVADTMHHKGIATLLLEHLVSVARASQIESFTAETLSENTSMLRVFSDAGLPARSTSDDGVVTISIPLPADDTGKQLEEYLDTVGLRERSANVASLTPVFAPRVRRGDRRQPTPRHGRPVCP